VVLPPAVPDNYSVQTDPIPCAGDNNGSIFIGSLANANAPHTFTLSTGQSNNSGVFTNLAPGMYDVMAVNVFGCDTSFSINLAEPPPAFLEIVPHRDTINLGETMEFRFIFGPFDSTAIVSYDWQPHEGLSCYDCPNPVPRNYQLENNYNLTVHYNDGCEVRAEAVIYVNSDYLVYVPNAFTPDGDGRDDVFRIYGNKGTWKQLDFMIFNRIGEKVFESHDINMEWDGTYRGVAQNPAVFVYYAKVKYLDEHDDKFTGSITLLK
jgi:gliding motility-associated-like protein